MRFHQLAKIFQEWGWVIHHEHYVPFSDYLKEMLKRQRVIVITDNDNVVAIFTFYLTHDYNSIYKKRTWDVVNDDPSGTQIYIDKMIAKKVDFQTIRTIRNFIEDKFPQVETAIYHRAPFDKCVKIRRKHAPLQNSLPR